MAKRVRRQVATAPQLYSRRRCCSLRCRLTTLALLADPRVRLIRHFREQQQVVATEAFGRSPFVFLPVETTEGGVLARPGFCFVFPDGGSDRAESDFMYRFCCHTIFTVLRFRREIFRSPSSELTSVATPATRATAHGQ